MKQLRTVAGVVVFAVTIGACAGGETAEETTPSAPGASVSASTAEPSAIEISNYELTMDRMRRWMTAARNLGTAAENDPTLEPPDADEVSYSQMIAWYEQNPTAREALRSAGITPRDFVLTTLAYMQAGMTYAVLGMSKEAKIPEGQSGRNVEFVRANQAELERLAREMGMADP
ncbi:MAG TPA: hypothetical protein VMM17_12990 [Gemmatimonadaceae bacterium]|nr:hypothetical protein [Gemmatimonadaceae bacterium]